MIDREVSTHLFKGRDCLLHVVHPRHEGAGDGTLVVGRALLDEFRDSNERWHDFYDLFLFVSRLRVSLFAQNTLNAFLFPSCASFSPHKFRLKAISSHFSLAYTFFFVGR
jgi:hypothetical protein